MGTFGTAKRAGLMDKIFPNNNKKVQNMIYEYFQTLTAYTPSFTTYRGGIYEMELTRAAIHSFASMCGKLKPEVQGSAYRNLEKTLQFKPNPWMDTYKFLYRIATILSVDGTAFIIPLYGDDERTVVGFYPLLPQHVEILNYEGEPWLRYTFVNGERAAIELSKVGIMTNHQYKDDFFGDGNDALDGTMELLDLQRQGMMEAVKQSAMIRFAARMGQNMRPEDVEDERKRFSKTNLSADNKTGVMMFDSKYAEVKQIDSKPFVIDDKQMALIQMNVYNYIGTNENIIQNKYNEDEFNAFYEGKIEPFAIQLSLVLSNMLYTGKELAFGNQIIFTSNRLQYASNTTKLAVSSQMFDRGLFTMNMIMDIWNLPHVPDGDKRWIRREYMEVNELDSTDLNNPQPFAEPEEPVAPVQQEEEDEDGS